MKSIANALPGKKACARDYSNAQHRTLAAESPAGPLAEPAAKSLTPALLGTIFFVLLLGWQNAADARIYKCVAANGSISYSGSECPYTEKTAKVMSSKGRGRNAIDCAVADTFIRETTNQMRSGTPSAEVFSSYGGLGSISSVAVSMINYIYTYAGNLTTTGERVHELAMQSCSAGTFGVPTCSALPAIFVNDQGGCAALDGAQTTTASSSAENERDRRRATRQRLRQASADEE